MALYLHCITVFVETVREMKNYSIMVHGGAGTLADIKDNKTAVRYLESIRTTLEYGREVLTMGGSALEAVEVCVTLLEDDPVFNAGCGSVLNEHGKVEMDAAIMDGQGLSAGAVASINNVANPVQLARLVMAASEHVLLTGQGAVEFGIKHGLKTIDEKYFHTEKRLAQLAKAREQHSILLDHDSETDDKFGTVGAVAWDYGGGLAAATSTGGITNKHAGRVGDSPIIGAGVYADNETCAVTATGYGEDFMRTVLAKTIADYIEITGADARTALSYGIDYLRRKVNGRGGVIMIDRHGQCASSFTTKKMIHGWIEHGGVSNCGF